VSDIEQPGFSDGGMTDVRGYVLLGEPGWSRVRWQVDETGHVLHLLKILTNLSESAGFSNPAGYLNDQTGEDFLLCRNPAP
jgi:hypothetical protein